jgi:hypothetical protein
VDGSEDSFRSQLEERIATYHSQRERIRTKLIELNQNLNDVERRLEAADELYRREFGVTPPGSQPARRAPRKPSATGASKDGQQSWREAIVAVLVARGQPLHVKEIWQALLDSGFVTTSRDPLRSVVAIAVRDPRIKRTAPNTYGLRGSNDGKSQMSLVGPQEAASNEGGTQ